MFNIFRRKSVSTQSQAESVNTPSQRRPSKSTYISYSPSAAIDHNSEFGRLDHARMAAGIMRCNQL
ncbi:hypothetical protein VKS41_005789 [Umbelopsis sp. WA50703]